MLPVIYSNLYLANYSRPFLVLHSLNTPAAVVVVVVARIEYTTDPYIVIMTDHGCIDHLQNVVYVLQVLNKHTNTASNRFCWTTWS